METSIIKIGNSHGLIIPKRMLAQLGGGQRMNIQIKDRGLFINPVNNEPRLGWEDEFAKACHVGSKEEKDPFDSIENEFDKEEWTW